MLSSKEIAEIVKEKPMLSCLTLTVRLGVSASQIGLIGPCYIAAKFA
jgi:hypothetical protein